MPKCEQRSWSIRSQEKEKGSAGFWLLMPENTKVLIRKEVRLYTLLNFFAEVGGYLGLLLGESLFSYLISASNWFTILRRKFKEHCRKTDETPETSSI